ncbi:tRNA (N(6)-L-threonylcarbamoyladenosine(37)-C(2))-methylthiotransferase MtaB [Chloroflexota bacterium]
MSNIRVALDSLGCKLNQAEVELLAKQFTEAGYQLVSAGDKADIYILNTCTVTHIADRKSRQLLRKARCRNPTARIIATGCYAQRAPQEIDRIEGVDLVVNNEQKSQLVQLLMETNLADSPLYPQNDGAIGIGYRTRSLVKIQDGCDNFCTYCIVPLVRGREQSLPLDRVIAEVGQRVAAGYRELVLTGVEIGAYYDNGAGLNELLEQILMETDVTRLRLSSLQPREISTELIGLWRDKRLCPHFHLSLQSGSDGVLQRMGRRYSVNQYREAVSSIRSVLPQAAITTDIIVGFPGETEAEFAESRLFCRQMGFARIHVFPYSPRQGTEAARMSGQVADEVKRRRSQRMLALAEESAQSFSQQFLGETMMVLFEQQSDGIWSGLTDNYIKVYTRSSENLGNKLLPVKLGTNEAELINPGREE